MIDIKDRKLWKQGNSWVITIPAQLVEHGQINPDLLYTVSLKEEVQENESRYVKSND